MRAAAASFSHAMAGLAAICFLAFSAAADDAVRIVSIENYQFLPAEIEITAGTTVRWVNNEKRTSHSILFPEEGGLESERLLPEDQYERRFDKPGIYPYVCTPHPEMKGVVKVLPPAL